MVAARYGRSGKRAAAAGCLVIDGKGALIDGLRGNLTVYTGAQYLLAICLIVAGIAAMTVRRGQLADGAIAAGGVFAAPLAAAGLIARRRWDRWGGATEFLSERDLICS